MELGKIYVIRILFLEITKNYWKFIVEFIVVASF